MPDQPKERPTPPVAGDEPPPSLPPDPYFPASAGGGELPASAPTGRAARSQLRAAIRSVYRSPHSAETPPTPEAEPEKVADPAEEETAASGLGPVEEYSIPAPAEFIPKAEKPVRPARERKEKATPAIVPARKAPPPAEPAKPEDAAGPVEDADPNPTLAGEATLSTTQLENYALAEALSQPADKPKAPARTPAGEELERAALAQALIAKARLQARQGHFDLSRRLFGQAITHDPTNAEAWTWLGGLLAEINLDRAKVCLTRAVELDATNDRANRGLAEVNKRLEERTRQQEDAAKAEAAKQEDAAANRAIVLVRPEIKIGLEEVIDRQRQSGVEPDPETIPLGGARFGPAIESGELKPPRRGRPRLGKAPVAIGLVLLVGLLVALIWLGPLNHGNADAPTTTVLGGITGQPGSNLPGNSVQTQVAGAAPASSDEAFALKIRLEIDRYNRFFLTAHELRSQVQANKINWDRYARLSKQLQADIRAEKKPLDNLAVESTSKLIQRYRDLQSIASVTGNAIDFTVSGIDSVNPEDLEEGNRQFNDAARRLTDLLNLLNQQIPLAGATPISNITAPPATPPGPASEAVSTPQPTATPRPRGFAPTPTP